MQVAALKAMSMSQRWQAAQDLYTSARDLRGSMLRALHPDWPEQRVAEAVRECFHRD